MECYQNHIRKILKGHEFTISENLVLQADEQKA